MNYKEQDQCNQAVQSRHNELEQLYNRRNHLERELHKLNKMIEIFNQNPILKDYFDLMYSI